MAFHLRSISLPSRPHATETEIEEERSSLEASISSSTTIGTMCEGLRRLGDIYNGVEEIICLPSSQVCTYQQRTVLDGEMDGSLELLDLCGAMQDIFAEMKAIIQELQLSLRKGDDAAAQASIQEGQESFQEDHEEDFGRLQDGHALGQGQRDLRLSAGVHTSSLVEAN